MNPKWFAGHLAYTMSKYNMSMIAYGLAAEQALKSAGLTDLLSRQKVLGDNIGQTTQFVATGAAQAGITALALAKAPEMADLLQWAPLPESMHAPLHQSMVLLKGASPAAVAWQRFLRSPNSGNAPAIGFRRPGVPR